MQSDIRNKTVKELAQARLSDLKKTRSSFEGHWRDIAESMAPYRGRFLPSDDNDGSKKSHKIINNTATMASQIQRAGMMTGITSPARPWFKIATPDPELMRFQAVKVWLEIVERILYDVLKRSNFYDAILNVYTEIGLFGTSSMMIMEDMRNVIRCVAFSIGEYYLAQNHSLEMDTHYRGYTATVRNMVNRFGYDQCSKTVKNLYDNSNYDADVRIIHAIEPRADRKYHYKDAQNMAFASIYFEEGSEDRETLLSNSGFEEYPCMSPRWDFAGQDIYATSCPGMTALGDARQLQSMEISKGKGIKGMIEPRLQAPSGMKKSVLGGLPSGVAFIPEGSQGKVSTIYDINPSGVNYVAQDIANVEMRIKRAFHEDLFLMLAQSDRRQITAREIEERHEEKLMALGPVLERLDTDLLDRAIERVFGICLRAGLLPPAPPELDGVALKIEYVSILAQAQKAVNVRKQRELVAYVGSIQGLYPEAPDMVDWDQSIRNFAGDIGASANLLKSDDDVMNLRRSRAEAQARAQQMAAIPQMAAAAKDAGQIKMGDSNAAEQIMNLMGE